MHNMLKVWRTGNGTQKIFGPTTNELADEVHAAHMYDGPKSN